jgi:hypothetical protein
VVSIWAVAGLVLLSTGCREEPPIIVKFEPSDLAAALPRAGAAVDAAVRSAIVVDAGPAAVAVVDAGVEKKPAAAAGECKVAADCSVVPVDCCDCANGGKQQAMAKAQVAKFNAAREKRCKNAMCTMMFSTDPTCGKRAECVGGRCQLVEKK